MSDKSKPFTRLQVVALLAAFTLLACSGTVTAAAPSKRYTAPSLRSDRGLRAKGPDNFLEERAPGFITEISHAMKQSNANKLFAKFKVNQFESNLLASAEFQSWASAVTKANKKNPQLAERVMASTLSDRIGDEALAKILVAAKQVKTSAASAKNLEKGQLANWLAKQQSVEDVFKLLKLDQEGDKLFQSPVLGVCFNYATTMNKNSDESLASMVNVLKKQKYTDESLVGMIAAGMKAAVPTQILSRKMEGILLEKWLRSGKTEDEVFNLVGLKGTSVDDLLESPRFSMWMSYTEKKKPRYMYRYDDLKAINVLEDNYNVVDLAKVLASAKSETNTRDVQKIAADLQLQQFKLWKGGYNWDPNHIAFMGNLGSSTPDPRLVRVLADYTDYYRGKL